MLTIALLFITYIIYRVWSQRNSKPDEPPLLPGAWPILGHLPSLLGDSSKLWSSLISWCNQSYRFGGVVRCQLGPQMLYVVADPDDMLTIANTCMEKGDFYDLGKSFFGEGLITGKASIWKIHRKLLMPAFSQTIIDTFMGVFNDQARRLVKDLENEVDNGLFDQWQYTKRNSLETVCLTVLGIEFPDAKSKDEYAETVGSILYDMVERYLKFWWRSPQTFRFSFIKKKHDKSIGFLHNISNMVLQKKKTEMNEIMNSEQSKIPEAKFKTYINLLLELTQKGVMNEVEVREHVDTIMVAGLDTTARTLVFVLQLLGSHPEVQENVVAELKRVFGDKDRDVEKQDLAKLVYLEAVIKESMRMYAVVPIVARTIDKDVKLKNCTLYSGNTCVFCLFGVNLHPMWGSDRHQFRPERWLDPSRLPDNHNAFAPFSIGKRACIGKTYALMSMKTTLAHLLRSYRITAEDSEIQLKLDVLLKPDSGYFVKIEKRT